MNKSGEERYVLFVQKHFDSCKENIEFDNKEDALKKYLEVMDSNCIAWIECRINDKFIHNVCGSYNSKWARKDG